MPTQLREVLARLLIVALLPVADTFAQNEEAPRDANDAARGEDTLELNLPEEVELRVLLQLVSEELRVRILYDDRVGSQRVSLRSPERIERTSLLSILESALRMKGLAAIEDETRGWLRIVEAKDLTRVAAPPSEELPEGSASLPVSRVFRLRYADPAKVQETVRQFLSDPGGHLIALPQGRSLIVTDFRSSLERVSEVISLLDSSPRDVEVEYLSPQHISATGAEKDLTSLLQAKRKAEGTNIPVVEILALERTGQIAVLGTREEIEEVRALAKSIDVSSGEKTVVYRFSSALPSRVDELARKLLSEDDERRYEAAVDDESGVLAVTAPERIHERIEALREDFDRELVRSAPVVRYYKLEAASAAEVLATIREIKGAIGSVSSLAPASSTLSPRRQERTRASRPSALSTQAGSARRSENGERRTTAPRSESAETEDARIVSDPGTNTLIVVGPEEVQESYRELIERLDKRRPQVLIELILVTIDSSGSFSLGVEISGSREGDRHRVLSFSSFGLSEVDEETGRLQLIPGLGFNGAVLSSDVADAVVRALSTEGDAHVIAAPRILVADHATGTLNSVQDAPFVSVNASDTVATTSFGGFENAGTSISVTPHISEGDHLRLEFQLTLSTFTGEGGDSVPPPRQRNEVESEVTIPDGHTIVVGGLSRADESRSITKIPLLGDIPLLRYLFSNRSSNRSRSTLFAFIRPVILRDDEFRDLKYLSERDLAEAGIEGDYPLSSPMLFR